ncbi:YqgE/AlgH family protein [Roseiconus lacunae]|uniref:YqgE/AlgH family protein n=1 Tax=Roseiconus lacunae TaxID=2605694 RepID=UPI001F18B0EB|nr:YqgE/AlgH family protein [Roseiconus lacunae]
MMDSNALQPSDSLVGKLLVASTTVQDPMLNRSVSLVVHQDTENVFAVLLNRPMAAPAGLSKMLGSLGSSPGSQPAAKSDEQRRSRLPQSDPGVPEKAADVLADEASQQSGEIDDPTSDFTEIAESTLAEKTAGEVSKSLGTIHFGGPLSGPVVAVHSSSEHAEAQTGQGVYVAAERSVLETLVKQKPGPYRLIVGHLGWTQEQLQAEREAGFWHVIDANEHDVFTRDDFLWPTVIRRATTNSMAHWLGIDQLPAAAELN